MGRPSKGWTIRIRPGRPAELRFTYKGKRESIGLGTRDRGEAEAKAPQAYAGFVEQASKLPEGVGLRQVIAGEHRSFEEAGAEWLADVAPTIRPITFGIYEVYLDTLARHFATLEDANSTGALELYIETRLKQVQRQTLKHEMSVIGRILLFARRRGWIRSQAFVPPIPKTGGAKAGRHRVRAGSHTDEEIIALIANLPEWSRRSRKDGSRYPIRARFAFAYATTLRPTTIDLLEVPKHWSPERTSLWIPSEDDKTSTWGEIPLSEIALEALRAVAPERGVIFGHHDYRDSIRNAAKAAGWPQHKIDLFCGQHFRSAGGTHLLSISDNNLKGVQYLMRHKRITTTAIYMRTDEKAGAQVIDIATRRRSG